MSGEIRFGTDGWRAIIAEDYTFENVRACAQGVASYLKKIGSASKGLVVGYDTRFSSEDFASAVASVIAANGIDVYLSDKSCPTPVVSYSIIDRNAAGGVVITASHNPANYNGFKYKPDYGGSASPEVVAELEAHISDAKHGQGVGVARGTIRKFDAVTPYLEHLGKLLDLDILRDAQLKIVVDSMYGAGSGFFSSILKGGNVELLEIHGERNPAFPGLEQPEPIGPNLQLLSEVINNEKADVGLATDGDADRLGLMDERGSFVTQLQTMALLALYLMEVRGERGALVKSVTTTSMIFRLGELYNVPVFETPVGFKHIGPVMMRENAILGGEESGGYGFKGHIPERDGIVSGLYILAMMSSMNMRPSELIDYLYGKVGPHHYDRIDLNFELEQRDAILDRIERSKPVAMGGSRVSSADKDDGYRFRLEDGSWVLIRFSGTEPLLRIYCETTSPERVQQMLEEARQLVGV